MPLTLADVRQQYPQYADINDDDLAQSLHAKFYPEMDFSQFSSAIGYKPMTATAKSNWLYDQAAKKRGPTSDSAYDQEDAAVKSRMQLAKDVLRPIGLAGRTVINGVAGLPLMAMDMGVGARNLITGSNYTLPSKDWNDSLNQLGILHPQTTAEKVGDVIGQMAIGGKMPAPVAGDALGGFGGNPLPEIARNYQPQSMRDAVLQSAQNEGYVVPPATAKPNATNKLLEAISGKLSTAQAASAKNQEVTNDLARQALGTTDELSTGALDQIRQQAGGAYKALRGVGTMRADTKYLADISKIGDKFAGAEKDFPELASQEVTNLIDSMSKKSFSADSALDAMAILREKASTAYSQGDKSLGGAYKSAATALEGAIERGLSRRGGDSAELLSSFRDARQLIAKTYSVEKALNPATGNVSATKIAQQLAKGKPLSGELKQVAQFASAFPKAAREFNESLPGISPLDFYGSGGVSAATKQPWYLLYPFLRQGTRSFMLSPTGQSLLTSPSRPISGQTVNSALYGARGLLDQ